MFFTFSKSKIFFRKIGKSGKVNLFLHGWGQSGECFDEIVASLPHFQNITIDFPPFGKSENAQGLTIFSYANMVISFCEHFNLKKINLIGHSFGGRVAILVSALRKDLVEKLVLVSSAGLKPKRSIKYYLKVFFFKFFKIFGIKLKTGSKDFKSLAPDMQKTFINIVSTHLDGYCPLIEAPTMIIFGKEDRETPIYMAKRFKKLIKGSKLRILEHAGHFCFLERKLLFCEILNDFLKEEG